MAKRVSTVLAALLVAVAVITVLLGFLHETPEITKEKTHLVTPEDIYIPSKLRTDLFGLFIYDENQNRVRTTDANVPFDDSKPLALFAHGMDYNHGVDDAENFANVKDWQDAGYNVGLFAWSQLADEEPFVGEKKVWTNENLRFRYRDEDNNVVYEENDTPKYSMAETFAAYYVDFMNSRNFNGREIRFQGLSLGAQTITATMSYLLALERDGVIGADILPDRVTIFDAFFTNISNETSQVSWLGKPIGKDGTMGLAVGTAKQIKERGIAFEYVASSVVGATTSMGEGDKHNFERYIANAAVLNYRSDWIDALFGVGDKHTIGKKWYGMMINCGIPSDTNPFTSINRYGIAPTTPTVLIAARRGTEYDMTENMTFEAEDDVQFSTGVVAPAVAGYVFDDKNGDGNYNERLVSRLSGARISLYVKNNGENKLLTEVTTDIDGYYYIPIEPIYLTGTEGRDFFITVTLPSGYEVTESKGSPDYLLMANDINADGSSDTLRIKGKADIAIINVGAKKTA